MEDLLLAVGRGAHAWWDREIHNITISEVYAGWASMRESAAEG